MTLVNIYAPNSPQPEFFHEVCNILRDIGSTNIIMGGDFKQVSDMFLDKFYKPRQIEDLRVLGWMLCQNNWVYWGSILKKGIHSIHSSPIHILFTLG